MFVAQAVLAAAFASPLPVAAATPSTAPSPAASPVPTASPLRTITITTAERSASKLSSTPQTTYVVDRAKIEASGYRTIAEAIRDVPGMTFFQYGGFGAQASYGELGSLRSIVLLDGLPITSGSSGEIDLGTLSSNDVERIEVVESGGSTLYGSGGAGGVINIITSVPRTTYLLASYGSFGDRQLRVSTGNGIVGASFERHIATNDYPYAAQNGLPAGTRVNAQALQSDGSFDYAQTLGVYSLRATARFTSLALGVPGQVVPKGLTPDVYDPSNRNDLYGQVSRRDGKFTTSLSVSGFRTSLTDSNDGPQDSLVDARTNVALEEVVRQSGTSSLVAGIDLSRETALDDLGAFGPPPEFAAAQSQNAVYAQQNAGVGPGGTVYAGLRAENDTPAGGTLEPAGGFLFPAGPLKIAGNAASSFIVPTLFDLYYPMFSNPALLPERDRNLNLVISTDEVAGAPKLTIFDRTSSNLITDDANFIPVNAGRAHFQGATLSFSPRLYAGVTSTFSVTDLSTATQANGGLASRVDFEPVLQGTVSIAKALGRDRFGYGLDAHFAGAHTESFAGPGTYGQYSVFDIYARARLAREATVTARLDDTGNARYAAVYGYPVPARSFRVELSTR